MDYKHLKIGSFGDSLGFNSEGPIKCVSLNNQPCQGMTSSKSLFYPFVLTLNKCGESCSFIDDPYASFCIQNKVKTC